MCNLGNSHGIQREVPEALKSTLCWTSSTDTLNKGSLLTATSTAIRQGQIDGLSTKPCSEVRPGEESATLQNGGFNQSRFCPQRTFDNI